MGSGGRELREILGSTPGVSNFFFALILDVLGEGEMLGGAERKQGCVREQG
jgi:hypothetical protein